MFDSASPGSMTRARKRLLALGLTTCSLAAVAVPVGVAAGGTGAGGGGSDAGDSPFAVPNSPSGAALGETIIARGSDTTYEVTSLLGSVFNFAPTAQDDAAENTFGDILLNAPPSGSSVGIRQLAANLDPEAADAEDVVPTSLARSSRGPRPTDPDGLRFTSFAVDAIVPVVFGDEEGPAAAIESLTRAQLRDIFVTCKITNFNQIGGADADIEVFALQEGSGTRATFDDFLDGDTSSCADPENILFENNAAPIVNDIDPAEAARAILPFSLARLGQTAVGDLQSRALNIDGIEATPETLADRSFPFTRDVYFVTADRRAAEDAPAGLRASFRAARRFVAFVCGSDQGRAEDPVSGQPLNEIVDGIIETQGFGLKEDGCETQTTGEDV